MIIKADGNKRTRSAEAPGLGYGILAAQLHILLRCYRTKAPSMGGFLIKTHLTVGLRASRRYAQIIWLQKGGGVAFA